MNLPAASLLTDFVRRLVADEEQLARDLETPVLVWEATPGGDEWMGAPPSPLPSAENPVVLLVQKTADAPNPFGGAVTLGRTAANDLVLPHRSLSRFHAYFQQDPGSLRWAVFDAASKNGTWLSDTPLEPNVAAPLGEAERIRAGDVQLTFLSPSAFVRYLQRVVEAT